MAVGPRKRLTLTIVQLRSTQYVITDSVPNYSKGHLHFEFYFISTPYIMPRYVVSTTSRRPAKRRLYKKRQSTYRKKAEYRKKSEHPLLIALSIIPSLSMISC